MSRFRLEPGQSMDFSVGGTSYLLDALEHPTAEGMVHSMEGGKAFVYHLRERGAVSGIPAEFALKVMRKSHVDPGLIAVCQRLEPLHAWKGLRVCKRTCIHPANAPDLIRVSSDLAYSMLMPWINGISWLEILNDQRILPSPEAALSLAKRLAEILVQLERHGLAHCDISSSNLILDARDGSPQLIDVEDLCGPGFSAPPGIPLGTAGYQHRASSGPRGQWRPDGDRFAGAVLLCEILAWADPSALAARYGESFFEPTELQDPASPRFPVLAQAVGAQWPAARLLLERVWSSKDLADCPRLDEWVQALAGIIWVPFEPLKMVPPLEIATWSSSGALPPKPREMATFQQWTGPSPAIEERRIAAWAPHPGPTSKGQP